MTAEINIKTKGGNTPVLVGAGLIDQAGGILAGRTSPKKAAVITDQTVADLYLERLQTSLTEAGFEVHAIIVPPGEGSKSFITLEKVCRELLQKGLDKDDIVIALGGGVVGDLAGLAASLTRRGLRLVMAPTTLLAQVDSSIGGKSAINTPEGKNLVGAINAPMMVLVDTSVLETLPRAELSAGYAEVVKHGVLEGDDHFAFLETSADDFFAGDAAARHETILRSIRFKGSIVEADEHDKGVRNHLNLGHTFGHAIEGVSGIRHGHAVAIGLSLAFQFSQHIGHDVEVAHARTLSLLRKAALPVTLAEARVKCSAKDLMGYMHQDKKNIGGAIRLIVPKKIGDIYTKEVNEPGNVETFLHLVGILMES